MAALLILLLLLLFSTTIISLSQPAPPDTIACNGVFLSYTLQSHDRIRPFLSSSIQPYRFSATATILNSGTTTLPSPSLLISFSNHEFLVSVDGASLHDTPDLPFNTSLSSAPTAFLSPSDLRTAIATAGDLNQIRAQISLIGTLFAPPPPSPLPLPSSLSLSDPSLLCPAAAPGGDGFISTCCVPNPNFKPNDTTIPDDPLAGNASSFHRRTSGDLTITYDVIQSYQSNYLALVTLSNHHPLSRLDSWRLSFNWTRGEFIYAMRGAYTSITGPSDCILGPQGQFYKDFDFTKVANCERRPTILDLPADRSNDTLTGRIHHCCRNGTILPSAMDPSQTTSAFQIEVYKMPPDLNRTRISPPNSWRISGGKLNPEFRCGAPVRVSPSRFPDPTGLQSISLSIATWQIVCDIYKPKAATAKPKCCVSFSAYYNKSVVPCKTCACGCGASQTCNATHQALLLPSNALLVPFDNRAVMAVDWAKEKHLSVPRLMPCGDNCGLSINWHINSDFRGGWTARMTLFNWDEVDFPNWFAAIEMGKAYNGYEAMYSFNGTKTGGNTIFVQGLPGLNYLVGEMNGTNPGTDTRVPGKQQSVISFTKKKTPGIDVMSGDGFPTKVIFNGEECSLPDMIPVAQGLKSATLSIVSLMVGVLAVALVLLEW